MTGSLNLRFSSNLLDGVCKSSEFWKCDFLEKIALLKTTSGIIELINGTVAFVERPKSFSEICVEFGLRLLIIDHPG